MYTPSEMQRGVRAAYTPELCDSQVLGAHTPQSRDITETKGIK